MNIASHHRVVFVAHSAFLAGGERSLLTILRRLDRNRFSPVVIAPGDGPFVEEVRESHIPCIVQPYGWWLSTERKYSRFPQRWSQALAECNHLLPLVQEINPDLVYSNTIAMPHGAILARKLKRPHIWHVREFLIDVGLQPPIPSPLFFMMIGCMSTRVIAVARAVARQFPVFLRWRVKTIYNGIDPFETQKGPLSHKQIPGPKLVQVGTIQREKGQWDAVKALEIVKQTHEAVHLTIIGPGRDDVVAELATYIQQRGLAENISIAGYLPQAAELLGSFDITLIPSWTEAFSRTALESFMVGVPVIASNVGGLSESLARGGGVLVPPREPQAIASAIISLWENRSLYETLSAEAVAAGAYYSVDRMMKSIESELSSIHQVRRHRISK